MTDPLTSKELVEKSYEYIERLGRECGKVIFNEYRNSHRKFDQTSLSKEFANDIIRWFEKRDKNVKLEFESSSSNPRTAQTHMKFRGSTKDSDFAINATVSSFVQFYSSDQKPSCFVKGITINVFKTDFARRKI